MNKKWWISIVIFIIICGIGFWFFSKNKNSPNQNTSNYEANKTSSLNSNNNKLIDSNANNSQNIDNKINTNNTMQLDSNSNSTVQSPPVETTISSFSTKIYNNDSARQNNISITCNTLNGTIVKNDDTFSFCNTVGQSSSSKGYEKADIFDANGNKKKGYGGGNCQISTTLYNAVLAVPNLVITERHEHSNYVPYIQKGKDAAVAYGSYDLKFRNNYGTDIKITAEATASAVNINIISIQ